MRRGEKKVVEKKLKCFAREKKDCDNVEGDKKGVRGTPARQGKGKKKLKQRKGKGLDFRCIGNSVKVAIKGKKQKERHERGRGIHGIRRKGGGGRVQKKKKKGKAYGRQRTILRVGKKGIGGGSNP